MSKTIANPILRGFNPDPDIIRVEDDYYIVTSTFEWFPGYQIHHSRDLINWKLVGRALDRVSQIDMKGVPDSGGVWAPCISYNEKTKKFYLPYTNVKTFYGAWKDTPNYLVTATDITGPWSEPVYLNSSGFDASFFHDDDGKSWLLNMIVDHRGGKFFGGIVIQEYDNDQEKLIGDPVYLFEGTKLGGTEGPHIYKRNGYYYLLLAEGGTEYKHAMTLARSKDLLGPYELHPDVHIVTSKDDPAAPIQKTGHGGFVETKDGEWYTTFLCGRPLTERGRCITGRESGIDKLEWRDDWPYLARGGVVAGKEVPAPDLPEHKFDPDPQRVEFNGGELDINFQSLRVPMTEDWVNQTDRKGYLRLYGRESLSSQFEQSLVARRVQEHHVVAETAVEFEPEKFQQMAGLVCYYNTYHFHYAHVYGSDCGKRKFVNVMSCDDLKSGLQTEPIEVTGAETVYFKADFNGAKLQFYYAVEPDNWKPLGPEVDGSELSDDYVMDDYYYRPAFTGAFVGMCCQDLSGNRQHADFSYFDYKEISSW